MATKNPFHDAPDVAVGLNLGLWALAIGTIVFEIGRQFQSGIAFYAIAPPLLTYGVYKLICIFIDMEL